MTRSRNPTFMRRRQLRLEAEEAQRAFNRDQRQHLASMAKSLQEGYAALSRNLIQQIAADDAVAQGQFVKH